MAVSTGVRIDTRCDLAITAPRHVSTHLNFPVNLCRVKFGIDLVDTEDVAIGRDYANVGVGACPVAPTGKRAEIQLSGRGLTMNSPSRSRSRSRSRSP